MPTYIEMNYDGREYVTREGAKDDPWDRDDTHTDWSVYGAKITDKHGYKTLAYPGELKDGDTIFVLYAVYSTGDSFGRSDDGCIEFISAHKDAHLAVENKKILEAADLEATIRHDDGTEEKIVLPWYGYFESLSFLRVEQFILQ